MLIWQLESPGEDPRRRLREYSADVRESERDGSSSNPCRSDSHSSRAVPHGVEAASSCESTSPGDQETGHPLARTAPSAATRTNHALHGVFVLHSRRNTATATRPATQKHLEKGMGARETLFRGVRYETQAPEPGSHVGKHAKCTATPKRTVRFPFQSATKTAAPEIPTKALALRLGLHCERAVCGAVRVCAQPIRCVRRHLRAFVCAEEVRGCNNRSSKVRGYEHAFRLRRSSERYGFVSHSVGDIFGHRVVPQHPRSSENRRVSPRPSDSESRRLPREWSCHC